MKRFLVVGLLLSSLYWMWKRPQNEIIPEANTSGVSLASPKEASASLPLPKVSTYETFLESTFERLPRRGDFDDSHRDFHRTPPEVLALTAEFGQIAETVHDPKAPKQSSMDFYFRCAADTQVLLPIRADCLQSLKHGVAKGYSNRPYDLGSIDSEVHRLADDDLPF